MLTSRRIAHTGRRSAGQCKPRKERTCSLLRDERAHKVVPEPVLCEAAQARELAEDRGLGARELAPDRLPRQLLPERHVAPLVHCTPCGFMPVIATCQQKTEKGGLDE